LGGHDRGIFLALAQLGLRPGEARALTVGDYHDGWLTIDKAVKGKSVNSPVRGTKTRRSKRLPVSEELADWIARHVDPSGRLRREPLFPNPRTGKIWPHKALQRVWNEAVEKAGLPHISPSRRGSRSGPKTATLGPMPDCAETARYDSIPIPTPLPASWREAALGSGKARR
jgi:integrase